MKISFALIAAAVFPFVLSAQTLKLLDLTNNVWRYEASGTDLGTSWRQTNYDDSAWAAGPGLLAFENNPAIAGHIRTTLPLTGTNGAPIVTYYFRTHFQYDGSVSHPYLMVSNIVDDGAVYYLNGVELGRVSMPRGPITYTNLALAVSENVYSILEKRATNLVIGENLLAAEVHQQTTASADIVFGAALFAEPESATTNAGTINYEFDALPDSFVRSTLLLTNGQFLIGGGFKALNSDGNFGYIAKIDRLGNLVQSFNGSTNVATNNSPFNWDIYAIHATTNGKIYIGGSFFGPQRTNFARLNWDGSLDTTYVPATPLGPNGRVRVIRPQPDGKLIIAGEFESVNGIPRGRIARLHADGSLDTTFATNAGASGRIRDVALLPSGKILIGGIFTSYGGVQQNFIARLDTNGLRDVTFANGGGGAIGGEVYCFTKYGDKWFVGGNFTVLNGTPVPRIALIDSDGNHDTNFIPGAFDGGPIYTINEQFNGRLIVGGGFTSFAGNTNYAYLTRLLPNGSHDDSFVARPEADVLTTAFAPDGEILVGGLFTDTFNQRDAFVLTRLRGDGPPPLSVRRAGGAIALSWSDLASTFSLQESADAAGPWTNSASAVTTQGRNFVTTNAATSARSFFRLSSP